LNGIKDFFAFEPSAGVHSVLAWSPENPDVKDNIDGRPKVEKVQFLQDELDRLNSDIMNFHDEHHWND
jgi:hypothetical protein